MRRKMSSKQTFPFFTCKHAKYYLKFIQEREEAERAKTVLKRRLGLLSWFQNFLHRQRHPNGTGQWRDRHTDHWNKQPHTSTANSCQKLKENSLEEQTVYPTNSAETTGFQGPKHE